MPEMQDTPQNAWSAYILPAASFQRWIEDSHDISEKVKLSKRELLGLILLAHLYTEKSGHPWQVGYDAADPEPNDGFVTDTKRKLHIEHKVVPQMDQRAALDAIMETYEKYSRHGKAYGQGRILVIFANRSSGHLIKVSDLHYDAKKNCPFDQVLLVWLAAQSSTEFVFHIMEAFPAMGLSAVALTTGTGAARVPVAKITQL